MKEIKGEKKRKTKGTDVTDTLQTRIRQVLG
jgi:hypothetical protein